MDDFDAMYRAHWLWLVRRIRNKYRNFSWQDAEDVAQDALLAAWEQRHDYDPTRSALATWLMTIAMWHGRTLFNRLCRHDYVCEDVLDEDGELDERAEARLMLDTVVRVFADMPLNLLVMERIALGDTMAEAAVALGLTVVQVQGRLQYMRRMLSQQGVSHL